MRITNHISIWCWYINNLNFLENEDSWQQNLEKKSVSVALKRLKVELNYHKDFNYDIS